MADSASSAATWQTRWNICVVFNCGLFSPLYKIWRQPQNRRYTTYHTVVKEDWATVTGNVNKKFHRIWSIGFWDMWVERQTDRQFNFPGDLPERYCKLWSICVVFIGLTGSHQKCTIFRDSAQDVFRFVPTQCVMKPPENQTYDVNRHKWFNILAHIYHNNVDWWSNIFTRYNLILCSLMHSLLFPFVLI